jgi:hypothetical protein
MSFNTGPEGMHTLNVQQSALGAEQEAEKLREQAALERELKRAHEGEPERPWWKFWKRR